MLLRRVLRRRVLRRRVLRRRVLRRRVLRRRPVCGGVIGVCGGEALCAVALYQCAAAAAARLEVDAHHRALVRVPLGVRELLGDGLAQTVAELREEAHLPNKGGTATSLRARAGGPHGGRVEAAWAVGTSSPLAMFSTHWRKPGMTRAPYLSQKDLP